MPAPGISVIIPAYDAAETIDACLEALAQQSVAPETYEVIVVDDGSTDNTRARVRAHPGVRLLEAVHAGPAAARNLGAHHARGEVLLFTDADCAPAADWIERMAGPLTGGKVFACPRADSVPQIVVGTKGVYASRQRELIARFVQVEYEEKYRHMARVRFIDFVDTYSAGYRRDVFLSHGGFDTAFPSASVEDQELSFRLERAGYRMVFVPDACVYHLRHAATLPAYAGRKFRIGYWKVLVHRKHPRKLMGDSHTPQSLRVQVLLVALGTVSLALSWIVHEPPVLLWVAAAAGALFALTTLPFAYKAWGRDRSVALLSPFLLLVRAASLGAGFAVGLMAYAAGRVSLSRRSLK